MTRVYFLTETHSIHMKIIGPYNTISQIFNKIGVHFDKFA